MSRDLQHAIAVVGLSGRSPGTRDLDGFDAGFFGINHREAEILDPQQRVFLETCWEALEDAGYDPDTVGMTGVFAGQPTSSYLLFNLLPSLSASLAGMDPLQLLVGNAADSLATRVSYKLNLKGPSFTVQAGESTFDVAVHLARQSLLNGECDLALAGWVSIDARTLAGEASVLVLKRADEALRDRDNVRELILGSGEAEKAPEIPRTRSVRGRYVLPVSARSEEALVRACQRLADHLESHPKLDLGDVEYTLTVGRRRFEHQRVVECRTREEAVEALRALTPGPVDPVPPLPGPLPRAGGEGAPTLAGPPEGEAPRRVSLPTYPFERRRYWIGPEAKEASAVVAMAAGGVQTFHPRPSLFNPYEPPRDEREETVCRIWQEVLGVEPVGIHDDFFQLGGHSLLATQILSRVRDAFGVDFPLQHLFSFPTAAELAEAIRYLQEEGAGGETDRIPVSPRRETGGPYPLSFPQERLWFLDQLEPGTPAFNVPAAVRLRGRANVPVLRWSLDQVVARHESLRTRFPTIGDSAVQEVLPALSIPMPIADLSGLPSALRDAEGRRLTLGESFFSFRIDTGPLLRALLVRLAPEDHLLLVVVHHIVTDGWSMNVFQSDFARFYQAGVLGQEPDLPALPIQYGDFADWQRYRFTSGFTGEVLEGLLSYWVPQLAGLPHLELRGDRPRPPVQTYGGGYEDFRLSLDDVGRLESLAASEGASLFMVLTAGLQTLFHRYSGQDDFAIGSYIANRNRAEVERLVGFFINLLALRADLSGDPTVRELLGRVRATTLGGYEHQDLPFEKLVEALKPERDLSRGAVVQVLFNLLNFPVVHEELPGLTLSGSGVRNDRANFDVSLWMADGPDGLIGWLEYNTGLFDRTTVRRMADQLQRLFEEMARNPERQVSELALLSGSERLQLVSGWGVRPAAWDPDLCFHELVERQAAATPDAEAVVARGRRLSYRELDEQSNRLARRLRRLGVGPEVRVAICMHKRVELPVAVLGVLKAGGAYVPLDATYASDRLSHMLEESGAAVILSEEEVEAGLPRDRPVLRVDDPSLGQESADALDRLADPANLAYVIFTSGSTGRPKGVMIAHRSLVNAYLAWELDYGLRSLTSHLQMASFSFDVFTGDLARALASGGKLVLVPRDLLLEPAKLVELARAEACDCMEFVPAVLRSVLEHLEQTGGWIESARVLVVGSDAWYVGEGLALARHLDPGRGSGTRVINSYGITETTIDNTMLELRPEAGLAAASMVPIGRPFANNEIYVLDRRMEPVPVGVPGELLVGGAGVARGYLGRPDLTAERFVPHPFSAEPGARLYRAGDLARWLPVGLVELLGRADHQVKVRGFRIEPAEIEAALGAHPRVKQAVVLAVEARLRERRLVGYVVPQEPAGEGLVEDLRSHLRGRLPDYMVPSAFVVLESFPLTPNGKVDRRSLPAVDWSRAEGVDSGFVAPRTPVEEQLAEVWAGVLRVERVGVFDSFFDLGGHSLMATQLVSRVRGTFGIDLPLRTLFESPTLAEQALIVEEEVLLATAPERTHEPAKAAEPAAPSRAEPVASPEALPTVWSGPSTAFPAEPVHLLVQARAAERPDAPAVVSPGLALSYGELDRRANRVARHLRSRGVGPGTIVALCLPRSPELMMAALGVLKAGAAYLPVDPSNPPERLSYMLADSGAPVVLDSLDADPFPEESDASLENLAGPDELAYVIYTSGSTGRPKGTGMRHAGLGNLVAWHRRVYGVGPEDRASLAAGPGFDASVWETWANLTVGASLHVIPPDVLVSPPALLSWLADQGITVCFLPTPLAEAVLAEPRPAGLALRTLLTGGDRLLRRPDAGCPFMVVNHYGPTEATVITTWSKVAPEGERPPDIGVPVDNLRLAITSREQGPVSPGETGELCISGVGLALGYLRRPDLTAERFVPDLFAGPGEEGSRMYRSGDLVRRLPDGKLEFLGRIDHQVKIRGFRIELGEVEAALAAHPEVREAAALVREDAPGEKRLVAYVVGCRDVSSLRAFLHERLPEPMIPSAFVFLDALPVNPNGKVDRGALPAPGRERPGMDDSYVAPRGAAEARLAALWAEVLGFETVGVEDSFLELGGHSLLATRIASRVRDAFGVELPPGALFEAPTVAALAARIEESRPETVLPAQRSIPRVPRTGDMPPSFAQERLWFLDRLAPGSPLYNIAGGVRLTGFLDVAAFARALREIMRRHEALHTTLPEVDGRPVQRISPEARLDLPVIDLAGVPDQGGELRRLAMEESKRPFDLARGPLLRSTLARLGDADHAVLFTIHHVVSDGWSMDVFVRELGALYRAFVQGRPSPLPELPIQYADFAVWQRGQSEMLERQLGWWRQELAGAPFLTELPADRHRPAVQSYRGRLAHSSIPAGLAADLDALARREGASLFMVLLAGLFVLIRSEDMVVGSPVANRNRSETEGLIGFFANTLALRARTRPGMTFRELLAQVKATALGAYANQDVPFERVVEELQVPRSLAWNPLFQVLLVLQNATTEVLELPGARLEMMEPWSGTAKLDLSLSVSEAGPALKVTAEYATDLFEETTVVRLLEHLRGLLERAAAAPEAPLADLPLFAAPERRQIAATRPAQVPLQDRLAERERRLAALRSRLSDSRRAVLDHLRSAAPAARRAAIPRRGGDGPAPLSFAQERLWFLDRLEPGGSSYTIPAALRLTGRLEVGTLARALAEIVRRHESLRTTFGERGGEGVQIVSPPFAPALPVIDLREVPEERREAEARRRLAAEAGRPFDLSAGPLLRAVLVQLGPDDQVVLLNMHHIVSDNWSMEVLVRECTLLYQAFSQDRPSPLPELPIQYPDFAVWQREWLRGDELEAQLSYWRTELAGAPALLELPTDRPRPPVQTFRGSVLASSLPAELADALRQGGKRQDATLFMVLVAGLHALLGRLTGQEDVLVGSPIANRNRIEVEGLIGFFVNTLVLRGRLGPGLTFHGLLERVRRMALDAYVHQDLPFEKLVESLSIPRSLAYNPLFQVMFAAQTAGAGSVELPGLAVSPFHFAIGVSAFDLGFSVTDGGAGPLGLEVEFRTDLFDAATVRRLVDRFRLVLEAAAAEPDRALADLPLLAAPERHQLIEWGGMATGWKTDPVPRLFEEQAARTPGAVAVEHAGRSVTYRELDLRSDRIAVRLGALGVGPEARVGLLVERTPDLAAAILGIWKAGGAYVPLDPSLPPERLAYMISDAEPRVLLTQRSLENLRAGLPIAGLEVLELEAVGEAGGAVLRRDPAPDDLAYLIYTSGTTGRPKAVQVEHGSLSHTLRAAQEAFGFSPEDRMPCLAPFSFDIFLFELLGPLLAGGTSVLFDLRPTLDVPALVESLNGMTLLHAVPALMREVVERVRENTALRRAFVGGDAVPPDLLADLRRAFPQAVVTVLYGPTEATIIGSRYEAAGERFEDRNLLGRPLPGVVLRVVDSPIGVPGELWIGGPGVTRGYRGQEELTAERFVERDGLRWYRTGDLARWLADGNLEFLGRLDHQVKLRGFRIELGEIEATLAEHPAVRQAVVLATGEGDAKRLVAYVVAADEILPELRSRVAARLPEYMMPAAWVFLDELPVTSHGKVDRRALAGLSIREAIRETGGAETAPRTPTEERLASLWSALLGMERVGFASDFFDLGGHSLLATRLSSRVREAFGVELPLRAFFEATTLGEMAARIDAARLEESTAGVPPLARRTGAGPAPLSFAQERLWFIHQLEPGTPIYNMPVTLALQGRLDVARLAAALRGVVRRHESLRTTFRSIGGEPRQWVVPELDLELPVVDLSGLADPEPEARRLAAEEALRPFDLERGPLLRAALLRRGPEDWTALLDLHHTVSDGWSFGVLVEELSALYAGRFSGGQLLPELAVQYADFAVWQREWLQGEALEAQLAWWREELGGAPTVLDLPTDRPRPTAQSYRGGVERISVPAGVAAGLIELSRRHGATLFMTLLAAFQALLHRHSGQDDVLVGSPVAGRNRPELERLIGFFVNMLVLRGRFFGPALEGPSFREVLERARASALGAYAHQDLPFERLVEAVGVERSLGHNPLFQAMLALQNAPLGDLELPGLRLSPVFLEGATAKFDLSLSLSEEDGGLAGLIEYNADLFDGSTARRMAERFGVLLEAVAADPDRPVQALPMLPEAERRQVVEEWNRTRTDYPREACIHELFEEQAARTPDAVALHPGGITYAELNRQADELADRLRREGVGPDVLVGLGLERSPETVMAMIAIFKAGGAYVPLDPTYPADRLRFMLEDTAAPVLITRRSLVDSFPGSKARFVFLDEPSPSLPSLRSFPTAANLAYVMYTSGSTGRPKGVAVSHRNVVRLVRNTWFADFGPDQVFLLFAPLAFDTSTLELWGPLLNGGTLTVFPAGMPTLQELGDFIAGQRISTLWLTSGLFHQMAEAQAGSFRAVRQLVAGGDVVSAPHVARVLRENPGLTVINGYGPTESTTFASCHPVRDASEIGSSVPIGRPISNTTVYLLDRGLRPVPVGVPGELCIGGDGLARGYLNRTDLTAERFVPDPHGDGERLYRTGDLARFLPDGVIEFLGRIDQQVKIRGFRIEPGEIEAVLASHPAVGEAAVIVKGEGPDKRLVAFLVGIEQDLRPFLEERLPSYMVPSAFVWLDALPLNPNGKVDRRALAAIEPAAEERESFAAPRTPTEELLAAAWAEVLGRERIGIHDDFFDLGGHSLLATRLMSRVRDVFGVELPVRILFETPRLGDLARRIAAEPWVGSSIPLPPIEPERLPAGLEDRSPLSYAQERLWFLDRMEPGGALYSVPAALRATGRLDLAALRSALDGVVRRHEPLRATFHQDEGEAWQRFETGSRVPMPVVDLAALPPDRREAEALRQARTEAARPFDLGRGPLLRMLLLRTAEEEWVIFVNMHHIVSDGWSVGVFVRELAALYEGQALVELPVRYSDFVVWQRRWLSGEVLDAQIAWWKRELSGASTLLELPADRPRPPVQSFRGASRPVTLPAGLAADVRAFGRREGGTLFMTLLAGFLALLHRYTGQEDVLVGSPIANRARPEVEGLIGLFVNAVTLRGRFYDEPSFRDLLQRVRAAALGAYAHQDLPFERLVQEMQVERSLSRHPLYQAVFSLMNAPAAALELPGMTLTPLDLDSGTAKLDLLLSFADGEADLLGGWEYSTDLFDAATVERMSGHLRTLLAAAVADPGGRTVDLPLLTPAETLQILEEWNDTARPAPGDLCLHHLFEASVARNPEAVAVIYEGESLTYGELDFQVERLARRLGAMGVGPESLVGLCLERGTDRLVAVVAVFKAGGAYLPLDPSHPRERLAWMLEDSRASVVLTQEDLLAVLPETDAEIVCLDRPSEEPAEAVLLRPDPDNLAYVIYTSGSTGRPNGVLVTHRTAVQLILQAVEHFQVEPASRVLQSVSFSFDASVLETWMALAAGATLWVGRRETRMSGDAVAEMIRRESITTAVLTPAVLGAMPAGDLPSLRVVSVGGDSCPGEVATRWAPPASGLSRLLNCYGPTETTVYTTVLSCRGAYRKEPPIGRPIGNARAYLVGPRGELVPAGVPGELRLAGAGLARGYLNRPELTAERFVPNPFGGIGGIGVIGGIGSRLYRTGDLARWLPSGDLEFLGRVDRQVKIRGLRIELGEIEAALASHPLVAECAVFVREEGGRRLVACVVPRRSVAEERQDLGSQLREHLRGRLPEYMVPAGFLFLEALPLTPTGKLDRRALAQLGGAVGATGERVEARDVLELELARIWAEVLEVSRIGVRDDFFELGGHSLMAVRLMARVQERFGKELPLAVLFQGGTVEAMAARLRGEVEETGSILVPIQARGEEPPLFLVHPAGGDVLCFAALGRYLGPNQPVYGLQSQGLAGGEAPLGRIEDMAALYLEEMKRVQPAGPYRLGGWSLGGLIAWEMARQLQEQGEEVALLALLDSSPEIAGGGELGDDAAFLADMAAYVENLWDRNLGLTRDDFEGLPPGEQRMRLLEALREADFLPPGAGLEQVSRVLDVYKANARAASLYEPKPYTGPVTLFRADEGEGDFGWSRLTLEPVEVVPVPGHHLNLLAEPHVRTLAQRLRFSLETARQARSLTRKP